jgi:hypothetical protein
VINSITIWLCSCGMELTVASERSPNESGITATAVCPTCREQRAIHTGRIISISARLPDAQLRMPLAVSSLRFMGDHQVLKRRAEGL